MRQTIRRQCTWLLGSLSVALAIAGCGDATDEPAGRIAATWSLRLFSRESTCEEIMIDRARVTATRVDDGAASDSGPQACADGAAEVAVAGGTYLVGVDTLAADETVLDHGEMVIVAAAEGVTSVDIIVNAGLPTGFVRARWSPPCPSGAVAVNLMAIELQEATDPVPCGRGEVTSNPLALGSGTARLNWFDNLGNPVRGIQKPYMLTRRGEVVELQF